MDWPEVETSLARAGAPLPPGARARLEELERLVLAANATHNLTRITEHGDFLEKHVLDSLLGLAPWEGVAEPTSHVDVGTGGGFPGLAIACARPELPILLVETAQKKARFLAETARALGLGRVTVLAARAEDAVRSHREAFDRGTARAVGSVSLVLEYLLPFVRPGGAALLYRGPEEAAADAALASAVGPLLGGGPPRAREVVLPRGDRRVFLLVPKVAATPERFPRRAGIPEKRPLP